MISSVHFIFHTAIISITFNCPVTQLTVKIHAKLYYIKLHWNYIGILNYCISSFKRTNHDGRCRMFRIRARTPCKRIQANVVMCSILIFFVKRIAWYGNYSMRTNSYSSTAAKYVLLSFTINQPSFLLIYIIGNGMPVPCSTARASYISILQSLLKRELTIKASGWDWYSDEFLVERKIRPIYRRRRPWDFTVSWG